MSDNGNSSGSRTATGLAVTLGMVIGGGICYALQQLSNSMNESEHVRRKTEDRKQKPANFKPKEELECIVCYTNEREVMCYPCRHVCICVDCSKKVKICPYCNTRLEDKKVVYFP